MRLKRWRKLDWAMTYCLHDPEPSGHYDVTPEALIVLKKKGISDKVLAALAAKSNPNAAASFAHWPMAERRIRSVLSRPASLRKFIRSCCPANCRQANMRSWCPG